MCVHCVCNECVCFGCGAFQAMGTCSAITTSLHETVCRCVCCVQVGSTVMFASQRLNRLKPASRTPEYTQSHTSHFYTFIDLIPRDYGIKLSCTH